MFWKKKAPERISIVTDYGEFVWDGHFAWECETNRNGDTVHLMFVGGRFNVGGLSRFGHVLTDLHSLASAAVDANREQISDFDHGKDQMRLIGITIDPDERDEDFQLDFSFANWPDGGLTVHFKNDSVIASHIDD